MLLDAQKAFLYAQRQINLSKKIKFENGLAKGLLNVGNAYSHLDIPNYDSAVYYCKEAQRCFEKTGDKKNVGNCLRKTGASLRYKGEYKNAMDCYFKAIKIHEETFDTLNKAHDFNGLGNCFYGLAQYDQAKKYLLQAFSIYSLLKEEKFKAMVLQNIGYTFKDDQKPDSAVKYLNQMLLITKKNNFKLLEAGALSGIASSLMLKKEKNHPFILNYYLSALKIYEEMNMEGGNIVYQNLGKFYIETNDFKNAGKYLNKYLQIAKESGDKDAESTSYKYLADLYDKQNNIPEAYKFLKLHFELEDSLVIKENAKQINEMEARYQNEKKAKEITILQKDNEIKQLTINESRIHVFELAAGIILLFLMGLLFFQWNQLRSRQKLNAEILHQQELRLKAIVEAQDEERNRIAKDLHDGVGQLLTGTKLVLQNLADDIMTMDPQLS